MRLRGKRLGEVGPHEPWMRVERINHSLVALEAVCVAWEVQLAAVVLVHEAGIAGAVRAVPLQPCAESSSKKSDEIHKSQNNHKNTHHFTHLPNGAGRPHRRQ